MATGSTLKDELRLSGLLKDDDFEAEHPRTGTPPNPGRFANKPKPESCPNDSELRGSDWPSQAANAILRSYYLDAILSAIEISPQARIAITAAALVAEAWKLLKKLLPDEDFDPCNQRIEDQLYAAAQPPKTLEQLQIKPQDNLLGYERRHIVELTPNLAKDYPDSINNVLKFGIYALEDQSNVVYIPRLAHEQISNMYSRKDPDDPQGRTYRQVISEKDFNSQREAGLKALRDFKVLK